MRLPLARPCATASVLTSLLGGLLVGPLVGLLGGCATPTAPAGMTAAGAAPPRTPIAVRHFVADWDGSGGHQVSPDGQRLLWTGRQGLGSGLFVQDLATGTVRQYPKVRGGRWARDSRHVLTHMDTRGNELTHVFAFDATQDPATAAAPQDLTPFPQAKSFIHALLQDSDDLLIESNRRDPKVFDLYRWQQATGTLQLLAQNPGDVAQWLTSPRGELQGRVVRRGDGWAVQTPRTGADAPDTRDATEATWATRFSVGLLDSVRTLGPAPAPGRYWALSDRGRDRAALVELDLATGGETLRLADARVDVNGQVLVHPRSRELLAVALEPDRQEWQALAPDFAPVLARLRGDAPGAPPTRDLRLSLTSRSDDGQTVTAEITRPDGGEVVLYRRDTDTRTVLATTTRSRLHARNPLGPQQPLQFNARDGLPLHGYLTLPAQALPSPSANPSAGPLANTRPGHPLPTVLLVHGGPWARDLHLQGSTLPTFLADRGYAVLQVNYRGSIGYGRAHRDAAMGEFGGRMHTDLLDGLDLLVRQGITDPRRVAIVGASYGGYAALAGMAFTPERFACGISTVGISDLVSLLQNFPPYWEFGKPMWQAFVGDVDKPEDRARMQARSPLWRADQVQGPLLLMHGRNDPRVHLSQSQRMADALRAAGKPVQLAVFDQAGHGFHRWPDQLRALRLTEDFLAGCLGGQRAGFDLFELGAWAF